MRSFTAFLLLFFLTTISYAQVQYEKGYIITKDNKRVDCLIKNMAWKDNPVEFTYKLEKSGTAKEGNLSTIKEFGIDNCCKFVNVSVKIDPSNKPGPNLLNKLDPVWTKQTLFLKVLLEGQANLYGYNKGKVERFFYSVADTTINPLIYKEVHEGNTIIKNNDWRQQLWDRVKIPRSNFESLKTIEYTVHDLKQYFKTYNGNFEVPVTELIIPKKKKHLNLKVTPGVNFSSANLTVIERDSKPELTFDSKPGIRLGLEAELAIPFNMYRWGILFEPNFQSYNADADNGLETASITYKSVEFPIGLRYYLPIGDESKIFLNGFYVPSAALNLGSKIDYLSAANISRTRDIETASNMAFGGGISFKKFSVEARYYTKKDILKSYSFDFADYNRFSVILGYKFLDKKF